MTRKSLNNIKYVQVIQTCTNKVLTVICYVYRRVDISDMLCLNGCWQLATEQLCVMN